MSKLIFGIMAAVLATFLAPVTAQAQSPCQYIQQGAVLTAAQWQTCFEAKEDNFGPAVNVFVGVPPITVSTVGNTTTIGLSTSSGVEGPISSTVGDFAVWNNTTGSLLKDVTPTAAIDQICSTNNDFLIRLSGTWQCGAFSNQFTVGVTLSISSLAWGLLTSTPTTLAGYGITNARTQIVSQSFYVNSSSTNTANCNGNSCAAGNDSNSCLTPATACLTAQHAVNVILQTYDAKNTSFGLTLSDTVGVTGATPTRYAINCSTGPFIGTSVLSISGNNSTPSNVQIQPVNGGVAAIADNLCTLGYNSVHFIDSAGSNAAGFVQLGGGHNFAHIDLANVIFDACGACVAIEASSGSTISLTSGNSFVGSMPFALFAHEGGVIDFSGNAAPVSNNLTFTQFAIVNTGGQILATPSTFGSPTGTAGARCNITGVWGVGSQNPNAVFPGSSDCIVNTTVGAIAVQAGSGGSSTVNFGLSGQCLTSNAGSPNTFANCAGAGVPQNNLNTQSGNYSIQTTDCGNTINATGAQSTITLPSVSGFATNCVLAVYNASSTRGQILSGFPGALAASPSNILWPLDTVTVQIVNGAWSLQSYPARHKITASITLFVDNTNGNDANDCLAATTSACKTRQGAFNYINTWDGNEQAILVSVAAGTYTNNLTQNGPFHGNPTVTLTGDLTTPSNVLISTTSVDSLDVSNGAALTMGGFKIVTTTGGNGIVVSNASFLNITGAMEYGASANAQINAKSGSTITITHDYTISGGGNIHRLALQFAQILVSGSHTVTITGTPAFAVAFDSASTGGLVGAGATTYSGSATGPSFVVSTNAFVNNNPAAALPGSLTTSTVASHAYVTSPGVPAVSSCGGSPGTASGTDFSGNVTEGTTATGCTITFATGSTFTSCTVSLSSGDAVGISTLGATLVVVHSILSGDKLYWQCAN